MGKNFKKSGFLAGLALVAILALALPLSAWGQGADDLVITGGVGGAAAEATGGAGGTGGFVGEGDDSPYDAYAAGGGGGGSGNDDDTDGAIGDDPTEGVSGGTGGAGQGGGSGDGSGGIGGAGKSSVAGSYEGEPAEGSTGGAGGSVNNVTFGEGKQATAKGGAGGTETAGGAGGDASYTSSANEYNDITLTAGAGGASVAGGEFRGGNGGSVTFRSTAETLTAATLTVVSGTNGANSGVGYGLGGSATFSANTLIAPVITVTQNDGVVNFNVGTLDVAANTTLTADDTVADKVIIDTVLVDEATFTLAGNGGVTINTVSLGTDSTLTFSSTNSGDSSFGTLKIDAGPSGVATLNGSGAEPFFQNLDLHSGTFTLAGAAIANLRFNNLTVHDTTEDGSVTWTGDLNLAARGIGDVPVTDVNFYLDGAEIFIAGTTTADKALLIVTGDLTIDISTKFNLGFASKTSLGAMAGQTVVLASSPNEIIVVDDANVADIKGDIIPDSSLKRFSFSFELDDTSKFFLANIEDEGVIEEAEALSQGFVSGVGLLNTTADLVAGAGLSEAMGAAWAGGAPGPRGFAALGGGKTRYNTGSHVDVSSISILAGLALGQDVDPGRLTVGAFFEYGNGSYDTYHSFTDGPINGGGNLNHFGGGILGRMDFNQAGPGHAYTEATARVGNLTNKFSSADLDRVLRDAGVVGSANYKTSSTYVGLHFGGGYIWDLTDEVSLDLYGKYFWTRQGGDSVTLADDAVVNFDAVNSQRVRAGGRLGFALNEVVRPYVGAAYEYEFDGRAKAFTDGEAIGVPELKGSTGIGELGISLKPANTPVSLDLGVQGYVGRHEGVTGSLQFKFEF